MTYRKNPQTNPSENSFQYLTAALDIRPFDQPATKFILVVIARHRNGKTGLCCPSLARLIKYTGFSKRTILRALAILRDADLLSHQKGWSNVHSKGVPNKYTLNLSRMKELAVAGDTTAPTNDAGATDDEAGAINDTEKFQQVPQMHVAGDTTSPLMEKRMEKQKSNGEVVNGGEPEKPLGGLGVVSEDSTTILSEDQSENPTSIQDIPKSTRTLTLPWMNEPSDFEPDSLPNILSTGDRMHSRLTFKSDEGLLNWLRTMDTRFDLRLPEDEIITRLGPDGLWAVDIHGIACISRANVLSTELRDNDPIAADMTTGGKFCKLRPEFVQYLPVCGCGSRVWHDIRMSKTGIGVLHLHVVCGDQKCPFAIAQDKADDAVAEKESLLRHYGGVAIPDTVAAFEADIPLGAKPTDACQVFGAKRPKMWQVSGVGLVEGTSYKDAEYSVREQREEYLDKKCLAGVV